MLQKTKAVAALQDACRRLGLPVSTAAALLQFLSVKRTHEEFVDGASKQLRMSPGAKLDTLWHCMLLNTSVSTLVHAQLGGVVEHRGYDATDLPDEVKLLQRLYALNILRLEGRLRDADLGLWQDPGTAIHTLLLTATPVPGLQHLPGGGQLYITPSLPSQQQAQLAAALQRLYAEDVPDMKLNRAGNTRQAAAAAAAAGGAAAAEPATRATRAAARAAAADTAPAARACAQSRSKRARTEPSAGANQQQQQRQSVQHAKQKAAAGIRDPAPASSSGMIQITVKDQMGAALGFKVKGNTTMRSLYKAVLQHWQIDPSAYYLLFDGMRVVPNETVDGLDMEDGDVLDLFLVQLGC